MSSASPRSLSAQTTTGTITVACSTIRDCRFRTRAVLRADYSYRDYHDFYSLRTDMSTGSVVDQFGNLSDLSIVENTNALKRRYSGVTISGTYHVNSRLDAPDRFRHDYDLPFGGGSRQVTAFVQAQVINFFNNQGLCACGADVFSNGRQRGVEPAGLRRADACQQQGVRAVQPVHDDAGAGGSWNSTRTSELR